MADNIRIDVTVTGKKDVDNLTKSVDALGDEVTQTSKQVKTATTQMNQYGEITRVSGRRMNRFNMGLQQVGYQVGDFAVQVQSGTNALLAFGQQGTQLLGIFGPKGAIAGALLAVGTAIGGAFLRGREEGTKLQIQWKEIGEDASNIFGFDVPQSLNKFWSTLKSITSWVGTVFVESINTILTMPQYIAAVFKALPEAIKQSLEIGIRYVIAFAREVESLAYETAAAWQDLMDAMSGSVAMDAVGFGEGPMSVADMKREIADNLYSQADGLRRGAGSVGDVFNGVFDDVDRVDIRDWIKRVKELGDATGEAGKQAEEAADAYDDLGKTISQSMEDGFVDMVKGTKTVAEAFRTMAADIIGELYRVFVVQKMVAGIENLTTGGVGFAGTLRKFLPGLASGGTAMGGKPYLVGEQGPELFVPGSKGTVMNATQTANAMGGETINITQVYNVNGNGDEYILGAIKAAAPSITNDAVKAVQRERRRGGTMKQAFG